MTVEYTIAPQLHVVVSRMATRPLMRAYEQLLRVAGRTYPDVNPHLTGALEVVGTELTDRHRRTQTVGRRSW